MKIYKAKITGFFLYFLLLYTLAVTVFVLFNPEVLTDKPAIICVLLIPSVYMTWVCFHTKYYLEGEKLKYVSGFVRGEIPITRITTIVKNKSMWRGLRPALAQKGIIIHFNRFDEIYLAPVSNDELIADLVSINKQIEVSE